MVGSINNLGGFPGLGTNNTKNRITSFMDNIDPGYSTTHSMQGRTKLYEGRALSTIEDMKGRNASAQQPQTYNSPYEQPNPFARGVSPRAGGSNEGSSGGYGNVDGIKKEEDIKDVSSKVKDQVLSQEDFLKLLTTQLQAQDPTKPADNNQLVTQMSQLSMVESLNSINENMNNVINTVNQGSTMNATSLIGTYVYTNDNKAFFSGSGVSTWSIDAGEEQYTNLKLTIKDANGNVVFTDTADALSGEIKFGWDGLYDPEGTYEPPKEDGGMEEIGPVTPVDGEQAPKGFKNNANEGAGEGSESGGEGTGSDGKPSEGNKPGEGDKDEGNKDPNKKLCPGGVYTLEVTGVNSKGETVSLPTKSLALVTSVTLGKTMDDTMLSLLGRGQMPFSKANKVTI